MTCTPILSDYGRVCGGTDADSLDGMQFETTNMSSSLYGFYGSSVIETNSSWNGELQEDFHNATNFSLSRGNFDKEDYEIVKQVLYSYVLGIICIFGIVGNTLNLVVLTSKGLRGTMERMEKSSHAGLVALAVSDMFCCITVLPHAFTGSPRFTYQLGFELYYHTYSNAVINTFMMSSTWLTVTMTTSRYLAICFPFKARYLIGMTFARTSIIVVFVVCIVFNIPRYWMEAISSYGCQEGGREYFIASGFLSCHVTLKNIYMWIYFVVNIVIPVLLLSYCNLHLVRALQNSAKMRNKFRRGDGMKESTHRITLTLIIIVVAYLCLVSPVEILKFFMGMVLGQHTTHAFDLAVAITNTLQTMNFALNFVLYCFVNVVFRKMLAEIFCFRPCRNKQSTFLLSKPYSRSTFNSTNRYSHTHPQSAAVV